MKYWISPQLSSNSIFRYFQIILGLRDPYVIVRVFQQSLNELSDGHTSWRDIPQIFTSAELFLTHRQHDTKAHISDFTGQYPSTFLMVFIKISIKVLKMRTLSLIFFWQAVVLKTRQTAF